MQDDSDLEHEAISELLIERFVKYRLPALLKMKAEVAAGQKLSDGEIELLNRILKRSREIEALLHKFPEFEELVAKIIDLYHEITEQALKNETRQDRH
jgi:hypothetical protein